MKDETPTRIVQRDGGLFYSEAKEAERYGFAIGVGKDDSPAAEGFLVWADFRPITEKAKQMTRHATLVFDKDGHTFRVPLDKPEGESLVDAWQRCIRHGLDQLRDLDV